MPETLTICRCKACESSLHQKNNKPPKLSIANGNYIGTAPPVLMTATETEIKMLALANNTIRMAEYNGGYGRTITGHVTTCHTTPAPHRGMEILLPRKINSDDQSASPR